jgi:hypothetical protein
MGQSANNSKKFELWANSELLQKLLAFARKSVKLTISTRPRHENAGRFFSEGTNHLFVLHPPV